jgi:hypothetical protein
MLVCVKTREIPVAFVAFVRTCRLTVVIMKGVRDTWDRLTLHRISDISGIFGKLRPDASVTAFAIIPEGVNLFPECCCQVAFMSAFVLSDMP